MDAWTRMPGWWQVGGRRGEMERVLPKEEEKERGSILWLQNWCHQRMWLEGWLASTAIPFPSTRDLEKIYRDWWPMLCSMWILWLDPLLEGDFPVLSCDLEFFFLVFFDLYCFVGDLFFVKMGDGGNRSPISLWSFLPWLGRRQSSLFAWEERRSSSLNQHLRQSHKKVWLIFFSFHKEVQKD